MSDDTMTWREVLEHIEGEGRMDDPAEVLPMLLRGSGSEINQCAAPLQVQDIAVGIAHTRLIVEPDEEDKQALRPLYGITTGGENE